MTTTFEKYPQSWYQNYCSRPTVDVEIIETQHICDGAEFFPDRGKYGEYGPKCHRPIMRKPNASVMDLFLWMHVSPLDGAHRVSPVISCRFCGNNEPGTVHYKQMAWSDETWCDRCGGRNGHPIGD